MMPITLANVGEEFIIQRIAGKPEVKAHLADLGFVVGGNVTVISSYSGNVIVNVKGDRFLFKIKYNTRRKENEHFKTSKSRSNLYRKTCPR